MTSWLHFSDNVNFDEMKTFVGKQSQTINCSPLKTKRHYSICCSSCTPLESTHARNLDTENFELSPLQTVAGSLQTEKRYLACLMS